MLRSMPRASTSTRVPTESHTSRGVRKGARIVEAIVMPTERARSPRARKVITLEAVPPGQQPTRTTPIASSGGRLKTLVRAKARAGMIIN